jgi:hypothetical protein
MARTRGRAIAFRIAFYAASIGLILAVWQLQKHVSQGLIEAPVSSLDVLQQAQLKAFLDMNSLITTLSTGLLGALGFLLVNGRKISRGSGAGWLALGSALSVALSLFFGYVVYLAILDMLQANIFDLGIPAITWPRQAHFYMFLLAVVLFGDYAFQTLHGEDENEPERNPVGL